MGTPSDVDLNRALTHIQRAALTAKAKKEIGLFSEFVSKFLELNPTLPFSKAFNAALRIGGSGAKANKYTFTTYSAKRGPNGPRTASAHRDILALRDATTSSGASLLEAVYQLSETVASFSTGSWNGAWFMSVPMDEFCSLCSDGFNEIQSDKAAAPASGEPNVIRHGFVTGRLSFKPEKSGKVRLIASPDYFTQETLKPIHDWAMNCLAAIGPDCTFDQRSSIPEIIRWHGEGRTVYSFDQTSCTDRFPLDMQLAVLGERFGKVLAEQVKTVMVDRDWVVKFPHSHRIVNVRWTVGQPLGSYGSWPLMALTHHLLVQYCAWKARGRLNYTPFKRYCICGDDIVIASKSVADCYRRVVSDLGMVVNDLKSHITGGKTGSPPVSEFAKIIVYKGKPLNPVRPHRVLAAVKDWRLMVPLLVELCWGDGWRLRKRNASQLIHEFHPRYSRTLDYVLTVPTELGGVGLDSGKALQSVLTVVDANQIHPWLAFIATKVRNVLRLEQRTMSLNEERIFNEVGIHALRAHPLSSFDWETRLKQVVANLSLGNTIPSVREIAAQLMEQGPTALNRVLSGLLHIGPGKPLPDETQRINALRDGLVWHEVLKHLSKPLTFPEGYAWLFQPYSDRALFLEGHKRADASTSRLVDLIRKYVTVINLASNE